ncbi:2-dehydropantoate 2-reductase [Ralstonia insidiosa]|jgi:2-dehydropantoate 2-reductase|uniref:2-dehydropantoate 2-reductase n=1 Tax=Ralstonia TaxID=48736 RepID=UPI00066482F9|nr:2-dehydropantoate 2-reductase [Ralstonia insidiosa]KMW45693.1 2-dehydropantoate 2-reductase [Ralstonia sp. MD27]MBX3772548.1 2-dehydropantoate 2-reductase [Ralstonia pickettii]NOZ19231.1 2-dehydropantoate 2-reductase [Betaproteobacteria bacterium]MBA9857204.1 2-dehydropantoate 2-reductase [Ralstonia insidiosa]MBA9870306.1 2-dehydropantoate 2-reductase [Ralstonia insidiosa]
MAKICIVGAGSIGCYLGGRLLAAGADVTLVGRARIGDELRTHGLTLTDYRGGRWQVDAANVAYMTEPDVAATADLVLVTVKSAATASVADALKPLLRPGTVVVSFQNGLGNADVLRAALPQQTVLAGMVPFNVMQPGPGAFHQGTAGELEVAASPALHIFLDTFRRAGLPLVERTDMASVQWAKLLLNLNNAINALANRPLKEELSQRAYRRCLALAQTEAMRLLARAGIRPAKLTPIPPAWIPHLLATPDAVFARLGGKMLAIDPLARSSMSDDLAVGRTTEVDWINGEVVRLADRLGQRAPVNAQLCALVHAAEAAATRPSWSGNDLLAALRSAT